MSVSSCCIEIGPVWRRLICYGSTISVKVEPIRHSGERTFGKIATTLVRAVTPSPIRFSGLVEQGRVQRST